MKRGILAGEKDVKVSYWRVRRWAHQLTRLMQGKGVAVVDSMHAAAALPEAFDGNHLGDLFAPARMHARTHTSTHMCERARACTYAVLYV